MKTQKNNPGKVSFLDVALIAIATVAIVQIVTLQP